MSNNISFVNRSAESPTLQDISSIAENKNHSQVLLPRKFLIGINTKVVGKNGADQLSSVGAFKPESLTLQELEIHCGLNGYPWMPSVLDKGSRRFQVNANHAEVLTLDIDSGMSIAEAMQHPFVSAHCGLGIETASSKVVSEKNPNGIEKFRLVFPLATPITRTDRGVCNFSDDYAAWAVIKICNLYLQDLIQVADAACKDASRFYFGSTGREAFILNESVSLPDSFVQEALEWHSEQERISEEQYRKYEESRKQFGEQSEDEKLNLVELALKCIPPREPGSGNYSEWMRILAALVHEFGESDALWLAEKYSPSISGTSWNIPNKIKSFRKSSARPVTLGTVFYIAKGHGFKFPAKPYDKEEWIKAKNEIGYQVYLTNFSDESEALPIEEWAEKERQEWARNKSYEEYARLRKFTPDRIINQEFVSDIAPQDGEIIILKSGLGTRKTQNATDIAAKRDGFIAFVPTNFLAFQFQSRADESRAEFLRPKTEQLSFEDAPQAVLKSADDRTYHLRDESLQGATRAVGCPDSIHKLAPNQYEDKFLITDELDAVVSALTCRVKKENRHEVQAIFARILDKCSDGLLMSGTVSDIEVALIRALAPNRKVTTIENTHKPAKLSYVWHDSKETLMGQMERAVKTGTPFVYLADNKGEAEALHEKLKADGYKGFCLTADTQNEEWALKFSSEPEDFIEAEKPLYIIATPVIGSGFSCTTGDYFKHQFQAMIGKLLTNQQVQFSVRFRDPEIIRHIYTPDRALFQYSISNEFSESGVMQELNLKVMEMLAAKGTSEEVTFQKEVETLIEKLKQDPYAIALARKTAKENFERCNLKVCLQASLSAEGHSVKQFDEWLIETEGEPMLTGKKCALERETIKRKGHIETVKYESIAESPVISQEEAKEIENTMNPTIKQKIALERFKLEKKVPGIAETEVWLSAEDPIKDRGEIVKTIVKEQLDLKATRYFMLHNPELARYRRERTAQSWVGKYHIDASEMKRTDVLMIQALQHESFKALIALPVIDSETPELKAFIEYCSSPDVQKLIGQPIGKSKPVEYFGRLVKKLGYQTERVKQNGSHVYQVSEIWQPETIHQTVLQCVTSKLKAELLKAEREEKEAETMRSEMQALAGYKADNVRVRPGTPSTINPLEIDAEGVPLETRATESETFSKTDIEDFQNLIEIAGEDMTAHSVLKELDPALYAVSLATAKSLSV